ncbi:ribonuclease HII [Candidatus Woesearchaeota archaeon]|nr:MAG: ribonuclease HII [Candidatus Woesearchaeota archaeon]
MYSLGIDEAGRGPVFGPLVMAGVALTPNQERDLKKLGVTDSKLLSPPARERLYKEITRHPHEIIIVHPAEIDHAVQSTTTNLNWLEADTAVAIIKKLTKRLPITTVIVDSPTKNTNAFKKYLQTKLGNQDFTLLCENKADQRFTCVAAASILAKVTRDKKIRELTAKTGINLGSGYLTDPATQKTLQEQYNNPKLASIIRASWAPVKELRKPRQTTLAPTGPAGRSKKPDEKTFATLTRHGFSFENTKTPYETVRMKGPGVTLIKYTTGTLLLQGSKAAKEATRELLKKLNIR